ncbi:nucleoside hydrolase [Longimycelium tulufanense]|uniref:Nucleoside hydrolase n=1 Tax=Longimycelium tulufanense TaxID=907463 RepID=A0A8J3CEH4_9PSEU|nr:nucleoside hydrolase [Longimycelium tulufanense]GGM67285.1 nucleoside hydrolase [Longimycelium tulufanense]
MGSERLNGSRKRIVLDTDPGVDDALAILYLAAHPGAEIMAVGSVHGNVRAPVAAENAVRVLELVGLTEVPVAVGARRPLSQALRTAEFVHGEDGLGGAAGPPPWRRPVVESAAEQIVRLARQHPGELSLLALGPLTNVALALMLEPRLPYLLREVVCMGGAFDAPGNINAHAEANVWHDPEAAELVLSGGFELRLVPLDVTERAWAGSTWFETVTGHDTPLARFASAISRHYVDVYSSLLKDVRGERGCLLHDPLAAAILMDPSMATYEEYRVMVELTGTHSRGATLVDRRGFVLPGTEQHRRRPVRVAVTADVPVMLEKMQQALVAVEQEPVHVS